MPRSDRGQPAWHLPGHEAPDPPDARRRRRSDREHLVQRRIGSRARAQRLCRDLIAVNLRGTFLGMKHQIRQMLADGGGAIVNTSSNAGLGAVLGLSAYAASKHGIVGLTKNAAAEYADDGIRVNAVCPAAIMTPLLTQAPPERQ